MSLLLIIDSGVCVVLLFLGMCIRKLLEGMSLSEICCVILKREMMLQSVLVDSFSLFFFGRHSF